MKIRTDFVTNSSSSSYIIAYKESELVNKDILKGYPYLNAMKTMVRVIMETENYAQDISSATEIKTARELKEWFIDQYSYAIGEYNRYDSDCISLKELNAKFKRICETYKYEDLNAKYNEFASYLKKGYTIYFKELSYHSDEKEIVELLGKNNPGFIILNMENE